MKNIIIVGPPRSGKTTLSKRIIQEFNNFSLISEDNFKTAYINTCYQLDISDINLAIPRLQCYCYLEDAIFYESDINYVMDVNSYDKDMLDKFKYNSIIIFLGYSDFSEDELFNNIRENDNERDWTYRESDFKLKLYCKSFINESKKIKKFAIENKYMYYDVSFNRKKVLDEVFEKIKSLLT